MHQTIKRLIEIENQIKAKLDNLKELKSPKIIAVSKSFPINEILPLIEYGHLNFGENKVQEAVDKWAKIKKENQHIKLHMIGKLQTNKVKIAVKLFDFIHSVDNEKLKRNDRKYDLLIPIKYNYKKPILGKGSCIFIHLTNNYAPTAGCIALNRNDFLIMLKLINKYTQIKIS